MIAFPPRGPRPIHEQAILFFDRQAQELGADSYSLFKLYVRFLNYYAERMPSLRVVPGAPEWRGDCAVCGGEAAVSTLTGWWACECCGRQGEVYAYEFLLFGGDDPFAWERCRQAADTLMTGAALAERSA